MTYEIIAYVVGAFSFALCMLPVFHPGVRETFIEALRPAGRWDHDPVYDLLTAVENGADSSRDVIPVFGMFSVYIFFSVCISFLLGGLWVISIPVCMLMLLLWFILNTNAKKKKNE